MTSQLYPNANRLCEKIKKKIGIHHSPSGNLMKTTIISRLTILTTFNNNKEES